MSTCFFFIASCLHVAFRVDLLKLLLKNQRWESLFKVSVCLFTVCSLSLVIRLFTYQVAIGIAVPVAVPLSCSSVLGQLLDLKRASVQQVEITLKHNSGRKRVVTCVVKREIEWEPTSLWSTSSFYCHRKRDLSPERFCQFVSFIILWQYTQFDLLLMPYCT